MLAAFKLEFENQEVERARLLLGRARQQGGRERVWVKSVVLERELGNAEQERELLREGLKKFPRAWKMWMMLAQLEERSHQKDAARAAYESGARHCPDVAELCVSGAAFEERLGNVPRARAILEQGQLRLPKHPELWLAAVRTERRAGNEKACENTMAKALQDCPSSGILWSEAISLASRPQRKSRSVDALKRCDNDPHVMCAVALLFMGDHKVEKARSWFNRAVTLDPDIGDAWAHYYRFECSHGTPEQQEEVVRRCIAADPHHGERWQRVSKALENAHKPKMELLQRTAMDIENNPVPPPT